MKQLAQAPPKDPALTRIMAEYVEAGGNWRFFIQTRFSTLAYFASFSTLLFGIAGWILTSGIAPVQKELLLALIAWVGAAVSAAVWAMDIRSLRLFNVSLMRAVQLESMMGIKAGLYCQLNDCGRRPGRIGTTLSITHSKGLFIAYAAIFCLWLGVLLGRGTLLSMGVPSPSRPKAQLSSIETCCSASASSTVASHSNGRWDDDGWGGYTVTKM